MSEVYLDRVVAEGCGSTWKRRAAPTVFATGRDACGRWRKDFATGRHAFERLQNDFATGCTTFEWLQKDFATGRTTFERLQKDFATSRDPREWLQEHSATSRDPREWLQKHSSTSRHPCEWLHEQLATNVPTEATAYQATSDYVLQLDDEKIEGAEIFYSRRHVAYLVISGELEMPLLVRIPEEAVGQISAEAVAVDALRGSARLAAGASERKLSGIERRLKEIRFKLGGSSAALIPAAAIVGWHTPQTIRSRDPVMRSSFSRSKSGAPRLEAITLAPHQELLVEVFFGSWDGYSQLVMPKIMQLEEGVGSSTARFAYYGLPKRIADDPLGVERSISGVPTLIVSVDGAEVGRLTGRALGDGPGLQAVPTLSKATTHRASLLMARFCTPHRPS